MKFIYSIHVVLAIFSTQLSAQVPQGIQYQAVVRNGNGDPLLNTPVQFRFTIENNNGTQTYYQETQAAITNALGGINLVIGKGVTTSGNFETINWKSAAARVKIEMDPAGGQNFLPFGITDLQSVPFALYAGQAETLNWNGNEWDPGDDKDEQTLTVNGNQLSISSGNAVTLPSGSGGGDDWGSQTVESDLPLTGTGTLASPLRISSQGATNGDVLKWNGNSWVPDNDNDVQYTGGTGISINGTTINNTGDSDNNPGNEIQTLSINGNILSLTNGGTVTLPSPPAYTEGTGIDITGTTISALNTTALWNANQLQGNNISTIAPSPGQVLKWNGGAWRPDTDQNTDLWENSGSNIYYNDGNVGLGVSNPASRLHIFDEDKIQMDDMTFGKWATFSLEFSSNLVPEIDDTRDVGTSTRRWDDIYATSGVVNTSDARDKENINSLEYGLDELLKLRPVSFTWKNRPERGTKIGLIAQELENVIPEVVVNPDRIPAHNSEPDAGEETRLGVYYSDLIPVLIKSIQEQEEKIRQLQEEIELLKKK